VLKIVMVDRGTTKEESTHQFLQYGECKWDCIAKKMEILLYTKFVFIEGAEK